ncbi:hypothetical protein SISNIDRAFT_396934, partial [Sistotremastrum niveocremeum HHB9708]
MFDIVLALFRRSSTQMLNGDTLSHERSRKLLTQMVNQFNAKMECGSPMASLYLLGYPDHYKSHKFVKFFWKNYLDAIYETEDALISSVLDYIFRPSEIQTMSLYDYIRRCKKVKNKKWKPSSQGDDLEDGDGEDPDPYNPVDGADQDPAGVPLHFMTSHSQHMSHHVILLEEVDSYVPNFIGPALPRQDGSDHELYAATMLTLFKPWRKKKDLKDDDSTWLSTFESFNFTSRQRECMKFFHLRYECLDAKDDFRSQR